MKTSVKSTRYWILPVVSLLLCLFLAGCGVSNVPPADPVTKQSYYFDTIVSLTIYDMEGMSKDAADEVIDGAFAVCSDYEQMLSKTIEGSDIWNINHAGGKPVRVNAETIAVVKKGIEYGDLTGGRFDITVGKAEDLWDFHTDNPHVPDAAALTEAVKHVDYKTIRIQEDSAFSDSSSSSSDSSISSDSSSAPAASLYGSSDSSSSSISPLNASEGSSAGAGTITLLDPEAEIDLGGIAKGYIADRVCDYLRAQHVTSAILSLGGNIETVGGKPAASGRSSLQTVNSSRETSEASDSAGSAGAISDSDNSAAAGSASAASGSSSAVSAASASGNSDAQAAAARAAAQTDFRIGIETPYSDYSEVSGVVSLQDGTMVTSGVYERYFTVDGKEYHHILDVKTGYPIDNDVLSVTIRSSAGHSVDCDALSTTCLILGSEEGKALIESLDGYEAAFILRDGSMVTTSGIQVDPAR